MPPEVPDNFRPGKASAVLPGTADTPGSSVEDHVWTGQLRFSKRCSPGMSTAQDRDV